MAIVESPPRIFTINVSNHCDARCIYCHCWKTRKTGLLELPAITSYIQLFAKSGVKAIRISGGEPLTRADLPQIIRTISEADMISMMCTSAKGDFDPIVKCIEAGLNIISISIDLLDETRFKRLRGYSIQPVLDNLYKLAKFRDKNKFEIIISSVFTRVNAEHLDALLRFIMHMDLLQNVTPFQNGSGFISRFQQELVFKEEDRIIIDSGVAQLKEFAQKGLRLINSDRFLDGFADFLIDRRLPEGYVCTAYEKEAIMTNEGELKLCHSMKPLSPDSFFTQWNSKAAGRLKEQMRQLKCPFCWLSCYADSRRPGVTGNLNPSFINVL